MTETGEITEDDLLGSSKSRKMNYHGLASSGLRQARIGQAPVSHLSGFGGAIKSTC
jgi:hypothetical protein